MKSLNADEYETLEKVVDILFPAEPDGIGAVSVGVLSYIDGVLAERAAYLAETYKAGVQWLHGQALLRGATSFNGLDRAGQEEIVDEVMTRCQAALTPLDLPLPVSAAGGAAGELDPAPHLLFMTALWQHTREGLFGDPQHGGNREGMIWKWLGYSGPQLNGYTDSEILENQTPSRPLRFAKDWRNHRG